jgi:Cytochrome P460
MKYLLLLAALIAVPATLGSQPVLGQSPGAFSPYVDDDGTISTPPDFREWAYLGTWSIAGDDEEGGAAGFHVVYTQPETIEAYRKTGEFPDGAVLVKELFETDTGDMTTGRVSWARKVTGWFIMVKERQGRFKGNGLWGDGWGWALFQADNPAKTVTKDYKTECLPCHVPATNDDWVYIRGYPVLRR